MMREVRAHEFYNPVGSVTGTRNERKTNGYDRQARVREETGKAESVREQHGRSKRSITPMEAMSTLFEATDKASEFFSHFKEEFDRETRGVRGYASRDVLRYLWTNKMMLIGDCMQGGKSIARNDATHREWPKVGFRDTASRLCDCLSVVISTTRSSQESGLVKKLQNADKDIMSMLRSVSKDGGALNPLLTELEMLSVLLERNGARKKSRQDQDRNSQLATYGGKSRPGSRNTQGRGSERLRGRPSSPAARLDQREGSQERQPPGNNGSEYQRSDDSDRDNFLDEDHELEDSNDRHRGQNQQDSDNQEEAERDDNNGNRGC